MLSLPAANADFAGSMFFSFVGCQPLNVGRISGKKEQNSLTGNWSGTLDGSLQGGTYNGTYDPANVLYSGTYTVNAGKQFRDLSPCIVYYIAAFGAWELFASETTVSSETTRLSMVPTSSNATWYPPVGTQRSLVGVIDIEAATNGAANAVVWQRLVAHPAANTAANNAITEDIPPSVMQAGRSYLVAAISYQNGRRVYYSGKTFVR